MTFLLNTYDKELDLGTEEGLQLYGAAKKGLEKEVRYDGTKKIYFVFMKLMGKAFKTFRLMDILKVQTEWEATKLANPVKDQIVDLFQSNTVTTKQVKAQANLIWSQSDLDNTENFFKIFANPPADDVVLKNARNVTNFKHAIAGANIWNSLTSDF